MNEVMLLSDGIIFMPFFFASPYFCMTMLFILLKLLENCRLSLLVTIQYDILSPRSYVCE